MTDTPTPSNTPSSAEPQTEFPPDNDGNKLVWLIGIVALVVVFVVILLVSADIRNWFALHTGVLKGGPDPYYNFWSGIGSDIGEATLISAVAIGVYTGVRKVNCHSKRCWRIGHHALEGTPYILCRHHHPDVPNGGATHEHILREHHKHKLAQAAEQSSRPSS
jgi:hypothetical protein